MGVDSLVVLVLYVLAVAGLFVTQAARERGLTDHAILIDDATRTRTRPPRRWR